MITFKDRTYRFDEIESRIKTGKMDQEDIEFLLEALRSCFFTEDGITMVDENCVTIMSNEAHQKIMGTEASRIVGRRTDELVEDGMFQQSASTLAFESQKQVTITQTIPNGKTILVTATPIFDKNGKITRIINNVRDVPILKQMFDEQLKQETLLQSYKSELTKRTELAGGLIAESSKMRQILRVAERVSGNQSTVIIRGESGVGKGVIARLIHDMSDRESKPMVSINCGAIPASLLESELFGYAAGAFTGANRDGKVGLFEAADGGVVFLDEIGELPLQLQPKLLSFLETGEIMRIGSTKVKKVDCRIIAATNRNLEQMVAEGEFREDLYYRLSVIPIDIPPLRERREDIIPLAIAFLKEENEKNDRKVTMSKELLEAMEQAEWKGNVRQLRNVVERMVILSQHKTLQLSDLPDMSVHEGTPSGETARPKLPVSLPDVVSRVEDDYIDMAMEEGGSVRKAADLLGIPPTTLFRKIKRNRS